MFGWLPCLFNLSAGSINAHIHVAFRKDHRDGPQPEVGRSAEMHNEIRSQGDRKKEARTTEGRMEILKISQSCSDCISSQRACRNYMPIAEMAAGPPPA